jgi:hypothetical protein
MVPVRQVTNRRRIKTAKKQFPERKANQGTQILGATFTPVDLRYPTDLVLLNEAREKLEDILDTLHAANGITTRSLLQK